MKAVIELQKLTKQYGKSRGVENLTFSVPSGSIFGFLGPNGAGKSTTINMFSDLIRPTSGSIRIFGLDSVEHSLEIRCRIGFLAGDFALDRGLTGWQQLEYFGSLRGGFDAEYVKELAERLSSDLHRKIKTLSRGNKQKIGLISALMHQPELLIFDEPTSGLDPLIQAEFNKIILDYRSSGKTVFISSHTLSEVQEVCDEVAFIREGRLSGVQSMKKLIEGSPKRIHIHTSDVALKAVLHKLSGVVVLKETPKSITCSYQGKITKLLAVLTRAKIDDVLIEEADLETVFMKYYEKQP